MPGHSDLQQRKNARFLYRGRVLCDLKSTGYIRTSESLSAHCASEPQLAFNHDADGYFIAYLYSMYKFKGSFFYNPGDFLDASFDTYPTGEYAQYAPRCAFVVLEGVIAGRRCALTKFLKRDGDNAIMYRVVRFMG